MTVSTRTPLYVLSSALIMAVCLVPTLGAQRGQGGGGRGAGAGAPQAPAGPVPRLANGKPDLSGHWANPYTPQMAARGVFDPASRQALKFERQGEALPDAKAPAAGGPRTYDLPYTDWGLQQWKTYDPVANGDYAGNCFPFGMSRNINSPHGLQIVHNPDALVFLFELAVGEPKRTQQFHAAKFKPDKIVGVVDDAHLISFRVPHAHLMSYHGYWHRANSFLALRCAVTVSDG